jgi:RNA polymerase sigma-70 factor (ECF subfamily)
MSLAASVPTAPAAVRCEPPPFEGVYEAEVEAVWRHVRRLGVDERDLEDVVHDAFVVAHRQYGTFDPSLPVRPWLFGIVFRVVSHHHRRARVRGETLVGDGELAEDPQASPEVAVARKQAGDRLQAALEALPLEQRAVFVLHDIEERSIPEIERILETTANTLYSRLRLARQRLARLLEGAPRGGRP